MQRHEFLRRMHRLYRPRTYFEIGVNNGRSLALSRVPSVAVDPAYSVTSELRADLQLVRATSDDFFAREQPFEHLGGRAVDLAFIDGMHLLEYALRDFMNVERNAAWSSVIVLDDQLPRNVDEAARERHTRDWAGDVYKLIPILARHRPDLRLVPLDTEPTGVLAIFGADASSTALQDAYQQIVSDYLVADPQQIPDEILHRTVAIPPERLLEAPFWTALLAARDGDATAYDRERLLVEVGNLVPAGLAGLGAWLPDPSARRVPEATAESMAADAARVKERNAATPRTSGESRSRRPDLFSRAAAALPVLRRFPGARSSAALFRRLRS